MRSKNAFRNVIANLLLQCVVIVYGFIVPKIIIENFGSDVNGLIASITQFLSYITLFESGFGAVVKAVFYKPIASKDEKTIASIIKTSERFFRKIAMSFVLYIIALCVIFPFIAKSDFDGLFTASLVVVIGISTFAEYFFGMAYRLFLQAKQEMYIVSAIQIVTYFLGIIAVVVMALFGADIVLIELVVGLIFVLRPLLQSMYVKKKYNLPLKEASDRYVIKQKWDGLAQHIAWMVHGNTDIVILTLFTTLAEVSVYSVYHLVVLAVKKIMQSFNNGIDAIFGDMIAKKELSNLRKKFSSYELLYIMVSTVLFTSTLLLITPFIGVYTSGVTDADYNRPVFGFLLVLSEFVWAIRIPYSSLVSAAGKFKETRRGAWVEAGINVALSMILVAQFGLVGVAVGTVVAMLVRTVEFVRFANKEILRRGVGKSVRKIFISVVIAGIFSGIVLGAINLPLPTNYLEWGLEAIGIFASVSIFTFVLYFLLYRKEMGEIFSFVNRVIRRKQR